MTQLKKSAVAVFMVATSIAPSALAQQQQKKKSVDPDQTNIAPILRHLDPYATEELLGFAMQTMPDGTERPVAAFKKIHEEFLNNRTFTAITQNEVYFRTKEQLEAQDEKSLTKHMALAGMEMVVANDKKIPMPRLESARDVERGVTVAGKAKPRLNLVTVRFDHYVGALLIVTQPGASEDHRYYLNPAFKPPEDKSGFSPPAQAYLYPLILSEIKGESGFDYRKGFLRYEVQPSREGKPEIVARFINLRNGKEFTMNEEGFQYIIQESEKIYSVSKDPLLKERIDGLKRISDGLRDAAEEPENKEKLKKLNQPSQRPELNGPAV